MVLHYLSLQHFRNYTKSEFSFSPGITVVVGPNTVGKTNLLDSIHLLATGKSFLTDDEEELVRFGEEFSRIKASVGEGSKGLGVGEPHPSPLLRGEGTLLDEENHTTLEVLLTRESMEHRGGKRYFVNGISKRRADFSTHLPVLLFTPIDLEIISDGPSYRRNFLDQVLEQADMDYKNSLLTYSKGLRQRNALLEAAREFGISDKKRFVYWDELLIQHGTYIHNAREKFIQYLNEQEKTIIDCSLTYDHSVISPERLEQYRQAEMGSAMTLVGPHRDDMRVEFRIQNSEFRILEAKKFASRGQQRLVVLQLKLLQLKYLKEHLDTSPVLLLDDIFSELDSQHIELVSQMVQEQQTILTTTHEEFVLNEWKEEAKIIELPASS